MHNQDTTPRTANVGENTSNWKGGRSKNGRGYIRRRIPGVGYVYEHRWVMEQILGRPLASREVVHHRNGDLADNRPENLEVISSQADHIKMHTLGRSRTGGRWSIEHDACMNCGSIESPHQAGGWCARCYKRRWKKARRI